MGEPALCLGPLNSHVPVAGHGTHWGSIFTRWNRPVPSALTGVTADFSCRRSQRCGNARESLWKRGPMEIKY